MSLTAEQISLKKSQIEELDKYSIEKKILEEEVQQMKELLKQQKAELDNIQNEYAEVFTASFVTISFIIIFSISIKITC